MKSVDRNWNGSDKMFLRKKPKSELEQILDALKEHMKIAVKEKDFEVYDTSVDGNVVTLEGTFLKGFMFPEDQHFIAKIDRETKFVLEFKVVENLGWNPGRKGKIY